MAGIKIVDLPPLGRDLASTDLLELSLAGGTGSRKITGQEIMNTSKLNIGTTAITSGTVGRVLFEGTGNVVSQSANLFFDVPNNRFGVGISTPLSTLHVVGSATSGFDAIRFKSQYSETGYLSTSNGAVYFASGAGVTGSFLELSSAVANLRGGTTAVTFTVGSERMRINNAGNVLINTTTDAGFRLDVNGTARVQGNVTTSGNIDALGSSNSINVGNGGFPTFRINSRVTIQEEGTTQMSLGRGYSVIRFSPSNTEVARFNGGNLLINTTTDDGFRLDVNGNARLAGNLTFTAGDRFLQYGTGSGTFFIGRDAAAVYVGYNFGTQPIHIGSLNSGNVLFRTTGNVCLDQSTSKLLIGTTTDAGYRLDVNGTARVSDNVLLTNGIIATSTATTRLQGSINYFTHNRIGSSGVLGFQIAQFGNAQCFWRWSDSTGDVEFGNIGVYGIQFFGNNTARAKMWSNGQWTIGSGTAYTASALMALEATDRGFLPPRMTQTQRNAIASPAIGLEIYQTDATEGKYIYKSSGWTYIG